MADAFEVLDLAAAIALHEALPAARRPASLHPIYVQADARRDPSLQPTFVAFRSQGEVWTHGFHLSPAPGTEWFGASSPYGYGGPLSTSEDAGFLRAAWSAYANWMEAQRVVAEYLRFHPLPANDRFYGGQVQENRQVVCIDLAAGDPQAGYATRLRQTLKKAGRAGLHYEERPLSAPGQAAAFGAYYRDAMRAIGADGFYLFEDDYFQAFADTHGPGQARLGLVTHSDHGDNWLAACLLLDAPALREYHLAASAPAGRPLGAASFALHGAALAAKARGASAFYLGGGTDRREDNPLLFFKGGFSPERLPYRVGSHVFHAAGYEALKARFPAQWAAHPERPIFWRMV